MTAPSSAWSLLNRSPTEAAVQFEREYRGHVASGDCDAACIAWCGAVASGFQMRDFAMRPGLLEGWRFARDSFSRLQQAARPHVAVTLYAVSNVLYRDGSDSTDWQRIAIDCVEQGGSDDVWLALGVTLAADVLWLGAPIARFQAVAQKIDEIALRRQDDRAATAWISARLHCTLLFADPKLSLSASAIQDAAQFAMEQGNADDMALASAVLVRDLTRKRLDEARAYFQRNAMQATELPAYDAWLLSFYKTWFSLEAGDNETALLDASRGLAISERSNVPHAIAWAKFATARTLAAAGKDRKVWRSIAAARSSARSIRNPTLAALCRLAAALCAEQRGKSLAAGQLAQAGLRAIEQCSLFYPPLFPRKDLDVLLRSAGRLEQGPVAEELRQFHGIDASARKRPSAEVRIHVLGTFSIQRQGTVLAWPRKPPRRPLELLKALIASGVDGATVERLTDTLWRDLDGDNARKAFATALYRLRSLVGENALLLNAGRLRIAPESVWVDALAFESAAATGAPTQEDLALYGGALLSESNEAWILPQRARLAEMHRAAVCRVGEGLLSRGEWRNALDVFGSALQRDGLAEVFYQGAIAACLAGGLRAEASALFERCRKELSEQLGLNPSSKTLALYRSVIRNG